jgi:gamma-D-glutamyl-L-lysine dipeptidyl-peptidase
MQAKPPPDLPGTDAIVAVPVTAAWIAADAPRPCDVSVTQLVPDMAAWMASLTHELRLDLLGRIATNALLGEPVVVVDECNGWSEVRLPWQPSPVDLRGYPAWIPSAHLAAPSSVANNSNGPGGSGVGSSVFCVTRRLVPVRAARGGPPLEVLSMGTRLTVVDVDPATGTNHAQVQVASPMGTYWIDADCGVYGSVSPQPFAADRLGRADDWRFSGALVAAGSELLGLSYLWGGISGWGVDCSGLIHLAHRVLGSVVPRDSVDQQALFGSVLGAPAPGRPVFFRYRTDSQRIHHVGLAVSETLMLHAPKTGRVVELLPITAEPYGSELEVATSQTKF